MSTIRPSARHRLLQFTVTTAEDSVPRAPVRHSFFCKKCYRSQNHESTYSTVASESSGFSAEKHNCNRIITCVAKAINDSYVENALNDNYNENIQRSQLITDIHKHYSIMMKFIRHSRLMQISKVLGYGSHGIHNFTCQPQSAASGMSYTCLHFPATGHHHALAHFLYR